MRQLVAPTDPGDRSGLSLWAANLVVLAAALFQGSSAALLITYWCEGCLIALLHFLRVQAVVRNRSDEEAAEARQVTWAFVSSFLLLHTVFWWPLPYSLWTVHRYYRVLILAEVAVLAAHHGYSFWRNLAEDRRGRPGWRMAVSIPMIRVAPLYLTLILGLPVLAAVFDTDAIPDPPLIVVLVVFKAVGDHFSHRVEHHLLREGAEAPDD